MAGLGDVLKQLGFGTPVIYAGLAFGLFHWLDVNASDEGKRAISSILKLRNYDKAKVALALMEAFDRVYTWPLFRWHAFLRSSLITIVIAAFYAFESSALHRFRSDVGDDAPNIRIFWAMILVSLVANICSDYCSLFVIRRWLIRTGERPIISLLIASLIGAIILFCAIVARLALTALIGASLNSDSIAGAIKVTFERGAWIGAALDYNAGLLIIPGLLVFAWLPLFALGLAILRAVTQLSWAVGKMQWFLKDGKDHPLDAVGYVAGTIVFALAGMWQVLFKTAT